MLTYINTQYHKNSKHTTNELKIKQDKHMARETGILKHSA
jgi:hypothetical protein